MLTPLRIRTDSKSDRYKRLSQQLCLATNLGLLRQLSQGLTRPCQTFNSLDDNKGAGGHHDCGSIEIFTKKEFRWIEWNKEAHAAAAKLYTAQDFCKFVVRSRVTAEIRTKKQIKVSTTSG
jgi:hypothetical protein